MPRPALAISIAALLAGASCASGERGRARPDVTLDGGPADADAAGADARASDARPPDGGTEDAACGSGCDAAATLDGGSPADTDAGADSGSYTPCTSTEDCPAGEVCCDIGPLRGCLEPSGSECPPGF